MQKVYFKRIQLDPEIVNNFFSKHPDMNKFLKKDDPFFFRISTQLYPGLLHDIICQDETNKKVIELTTKLNNLLDGDITPKKVLNLDLSIFGNKADLIKQVSQDVEDDKLKLTIVRLLSTAEIVKQLTKYDGLKVDTAKQFALFTCGKQDVLCFENFDFLIGLRLFLNKDKLDKEDIIKIKREYQNDGSIFSLCMWKIRFSRKQ